MPNARFKGEPHYRALHVVDHSWPILSGYSVRTKNLVQAQGRLGHKVRVLTGPTQQLDDPGASDGIFDNVPHSRTPLTDGISGRIMRQRYPLLRELSVVLFLRSRILKILDSDQFDVVHAHSPALCGLAAWHAAISRNIPFIYEVRGFWEDSAVDHNKMKEDSIRYRLARGLETFVTYKADAVVGISQQILSDLQHRKINPAKLFHIPNGVDTERFSPTAWDADLAAQVGVCRERPTLGFIGSLWSFEGISWLIREAAELRRRAGLFNLLIVGQGEDLAAARAAVRDLGAKEYVFLQGAVPHEQVHRYYSLMDILVYPRRRARVTEKVTPLKPLEAMALGKAVLAARVGGLKELIEDEKTGLLFEPEDVDEFCRQATRLIANEGLRRKLGERAQTEVRREKDWKELARRYEEVYRLAVSCHEDGKLRVAR